MTSPEPFGCAPLDHLALARGTVDRVTKRRTDKDWICLLYTSDAADE